MQYFLKMRDVHALDHCKSIMQDRIRWSVFLGEFPLILLLFELDLDHSKELRCNIFICMLNSFKN